MTLRCVAFLGQGQGYPDSTLAQLYDPLKMPAPLRKAHESLDRAVDRCYRRESFTSERQRVEFLFALYEKLTTPLVAATEPKRRVRARETVSPASYTEPPPRPHPDPIGAQAEPDTAHFYFFNEEPPAYGEK